MTVGGFDTSTHCSTNYEYSDLLPQAEWSPLALEVTADQVHCSDV